MGKAEQVRDGSALAQVGLNGFEGGRILGVVCIYPDGLPQAVVLWLLVLVITYPDEDQPPLIEVGQTRVFLDDVRGAGLRGDDENDGLSGTDGLADMLFLVGLLLTRGMLLGPDHDFTRFEVSGEASGEFDISGGSREEDALAGDRLDERLGCYQYVQWEDKGGFEVGWAAGCDHHAHDALQAGIPDGGAAEARCHAEALSFDILDQDPVRWLADRAGVQWPTHHRHSLRESRRARK